MAKNDKDIDYYDFYEGFEMDDNVAAVKEEENENYFDFFKNFETTDAVATKAKQEEAINSDFFDGSDIKDAVGTITNEEKAKEINLDMIKTQLCDETKQETKKLQKEAKFVDPTNEISNSTNFPTYEEKVAADSRSIYVGNVDYTATYCDLRDHFIRCGVVNRVSIMRDKFTGRSKGYAFIEFENENSVQMAMELNESLFKGRQIRVSKKRFNPSGLSSTNRRRGGNRWQRARVNWMPRVGPHRQTRKSNNYTNRFTPY